MVRKTIQEALRKTKHKRSFTQILFTLIIAFAVVAFWRGSWGILDIYLFPENYLISSIVSIFIGIIILYFTKHLAKELI